MINNPGPEILVLGFPVASPTKLTPLPASALGGSTVGPLKACYVELPSPAGRGNDATAVRGNAGQPFSTVQAAILAAQSGDEIIIAPGLFGITSSIVNGAKTNLALRGAGASLTILGGETGIDVVDLSGTLAAFAISDLSIVAKSGAALIVDGTGEGGAFLADGLSLRNVILSGGDVDVSFASRVLFQSCRMLGSAFSIHTCAETTICAVESEATHQVTWDNTSADKPATGRSPVTFCCGTSIAGDLDLGGEVAVYADRSCRCVGDVTGSLGLTRDGATLAPSIEFHGSAQAFLFSGGGAFPDGFGPQVLCDLIGSISSGGSFEVAAPAGSTVSVLLAGATLQSLTIGDGVIAQASGCNPLADPGANFTTAGTGAIAPPPFVIAAPFPASPETVALPFTLPSTSYQVSVEFDALATTSISIANKSPTNFDLQSQFVDPGTQTLCLITWRQ